MSEFRYGDVIWANFDPSSGHEQIKRRPAIVVSNDGYNAYNNLVMVVPVTSDGRYPLHVEIGEIPSEEGTGTVRGWAEVEQLKSLDLEARDACRVTTLDDAALEELTEMVLGCLMKPSMTIEYIY